MDEIREESLRDRIRRRARWVRARWKPLAIVGAWILSTWLLISVYDLMRVTPARLSEYQVRDMIAHAMASATPPPPFSAEAYAVIRPSVVFVQTRILTTQEGKTEGTRGSGVIIDDRGAILTSLHVVEKAIEIQVTFFDGSKSEAFIVARSVEEDIALLRARTAPEGILPAVLGSSRGLRVGDEVFAVGSPFGIQNSLSAGVVSGLNRSFKPPGRTEPLRNVIQFDAAVNPGNSGGPLINRAGEVIGIVTGLVNPTDQDVFIGIGFAVPIETAGGVGMPPPY